MTNPDDHTGEFRPLAELMGSLGLSADQRAAVLDGCRRELDEHARRLRAEHVGTHETGLGPAAGARILPLREAERRHLLAALRHTGGKIYGRDGAAKLLDLKPTTLQSKLKKHGINRLDATGEDGADEGPRTPKASEIGGAAKDGSPPAPANEAGPPTQRAAE